MLIVMSLKATKEQLDAVVKAVEDMGLRAAPIPGQRTDCDRGARQRGVRGRSDDP